MESFMIVGDVNVVVVPNAAFRLLVPASLFSNRSLGIITALVLGLVDGLG